MTERDELVRQRDEAQDPWFKFLDEIWFGTKEQRAANVSNPDRYRSLRKAFEEAQRNLDNWRR